MKAVVVHQYGGPEVLKFEEYPDPVAGPGEVLVRIAAASVNPIDYKRRAGLTKDFYPLKFPHRVFRCRVVVIHCYHCVWVRHILSPLQVWAISHLLF